jgi:hypothetical protein
VAGAVAPAAAQTVADNQDCRKQIGKSAESVVKTGLKSQEGCTKAANKVCVESSFCSDPDTAIFVVLDKGKYSVGKTKQDAKLTDKCGPAVETRANYSGLDIGPTMYPTIDDLLEASRNAVVGTENQACDATDVTCQQEIAKAFGKIANKAIKEATSCQKAIDADATTVGEFGGVDPTCILPASQAKIAQTITSANAKVAQRCTTPPGGTCTPLSTCIASGAVALAQNVIQAAYPAINCSPTIGTRTVTVTLNTPTDLSGLTFDVGYPFNQSGIAGNGDVSGALTDLTPGSFFSAFDSDRSVRVSMVGQTYGDGDPLVDILFDECKELALSTCAVTAAPCGVTTVDCYVGMCTGGDPCNGDEHCPGGETCTGGNPANFCAPRNNVCSTTQHQECGDASVPDPACPTGEQCATQAQLTTCTVVDAVDALAQPVSGVTCDVSIN